MSGKSALVDVVMMSGKPALVDVVVMSGKSALVDVAVTAVELLFIERHPKQNTSCLAIQVHQGHKVGLGQAMTSQDLFEVIHSTIIINSHIILIYKCLRSLL